MLTYWKKKIKKLKEANTHAEKIKQSTLITSSVWKSTAKQKMEFSEFEKMSGTLSRFDNCALFQKEDWIVLEKVHGANFSFHVNDEGTVKPARRRAILKENENFFAYREAEFITTAPEKMKKIFAEVVKRFPNKNISQVSIWGELFGGTYVSC